MFQGSDGDEETQSKPCGYHSKPTTATEVLQTLHASTGEGDPHLLSQYLYPPKGPNTAIHLVKLL